MSTNNDNLILETLQQSLRAHRETIELLRDVQREVQELRALVVDEAAEHGDGPARPVPLPMLKSVVAKSELS